MDLNSPECFRALCDAIEDTSCVEDVRGYAGPEAAGKSCLSIVVAPDQAVRLLLELGWNLGKRPWRDASAGNELFDQLAANVRAEAVGDSTFVYFPAVDWRLVGDEY